MPRFFVEKEAVGEEFLVISGEDAKHISLSLRAKPGEKVTVSDADGTDYECEIQSFSKNDVELKILERHKCLAEPDVDITLYQALVKSDKFDFIVQKCVELGVKRIVPVLTDRCISRPDESSFSKKLARWNKISKEAAMQSGRGIVPAVENVVSYNDALDAIKKTQMGFVCYEATPREPINALFEKQGVIPREIAFFVGPEGGISDKEIQRALEKEVLIAGLGNRILRTETAPLCVMSVLMLLTGNMN